MAKKGLNITIPLQGVFDEFKLSKSQVDDIKQSVKGALVEEIYRNWLEAANRNLNKTRDRYKAGILVQDSGRFNGSIVLVGKLNNMIENGVSAFDIKVGFEKSAKVKYNKDGGWYLTVPFRFATPDAGGFSSVFTGGVLPQEIYDIVSGFNGKQTETLYGHSDQEIVVKSGDYLKGKDVPAPFNQPKTRERVIVESINKAYEQYVNKSSIYQGLMKDTKTYDSATQGTYNTFRRVGKNSSDLSWIHTGIKQYNLAQEAVDNTDDQTIVDNTVDKLLSSFGF